MRFMFTVLLLCLLRITNAQTLSVEEQHLEKWIPSAIGEYVLEGSPMTITSRVEEKPYIMSSKNFKKDKSTLEIVIFDYKSVPSLLEKYTSSWSAQTIDDEFQKVTSTTVDNFKAWESTDKKKKAAQLYVNVKDRYLVFLSGSEISAEFLKKVFLELKPRQLPK